MRAEKAWVITILLILLPNDSFSEDKHSFSFVSDSSSLSYRSIFIKQSVDEAIFTNSSLKFTFHSNEAIHFGFFKCGVYSLATTSKISEAIYIFSGNSLKNMKAMINLSCASDSHTNSFDIVINSKEPTGVDVMFESIPRTSIIQEKPSPYLRSMYSLAIHFDIPAFSSKSYPIQLKALVLRVLRNSSTVLQVSSNSISHFEYFMEKCDWKLPGLKIYNQKQTKSILELIDHSCDNEWLVDTVNVHISNTENSEITGTLQFKMISSSHDQGVEKEIISLEPMKTSNNVPIVALHITNSKDEDSGILWFIAIVLFIAFFVFLVKVVVCNGSKLYGKLFKSGCYNVANQERFRLAPDCIEDSQQDIELVRYSSKEESLCTI